MERLRARATPRPDVEDEWTFPEEPVPEEAPILETGPEEASPAPPAPSGTEEAAVPRNGHVKSARDEERERRRWLYAVSLLATGALVFGMLVLIERFDFRAALSLAP
jgi:hypothetical protein